MSLVFNGDGRTIRITKEINVISGPEKKGFLTQRDGGGGQNQKRWIGNGLLDPPKYVLLMLFCG